MNISLILLNFRGLQAWSASGGHTLDALFLLRRVGKVEL